jgi:hypothetical protein
MRVDERDNGYDGNTLRIPLRPIDDAELDRIEAMRAAMARAMGIPVPTAGAYQFHMTLAYLCAPFTAEQQQQALNALGVWKARLANNSPDIRFGPPEYCTFKDMFAFHRQFFVGMD